jgi:hypothetical protein
VALVCVLGCGFRRGLWLSVWGVFAGVGSVAVDIGWCRGSWDVVTGDFAGVGKSGNFFLMIFY